jgi:regulatory protein
MAHAFHQPYCTVAPLLILALESVAMQKRRVRRKPDDQAEPELPRRTFDPEKERNRIFQQAIKLLAAKPRSVAELRERLMSKSGRAEAIVESVLNKLREYGYVDDERFAHDYVSLRLRQRPLGRRRLQHDLALKKVDRGAAEGALKAAYEEIPEDQLIDRAIERRTRLRGCPASRAEAKKLLDHLLRQGFSYELASQKVRAASATSLQEEDTD